MNNSMMPPDAVEPQDYARTGAILRLCNEFNRFVIADLITKQRSHEIANQMTQDEAAEMQYLDYQSGTMPQGNDKEMAEADMLGIVLCDIFTGIIARIEPDDDEVTKHIPVAMATENTALYLEKYNMTALAHYARKAIP